MTKAYAKINVALNILGKNDEGFHEVDMVMLPIDLHDSIEVTILPPNAEETFITCDMFDLSSVKYDVVKESIEALRKKFNFKQNFRVKIYKRIPVAAGLAGGSSDAAAVINAIIKMLKLEVTEHDLYEIGTQIGCDIPFCLFNRGARCTGKGEKLEFLESYTKYFVLIIKPRLGLSTEEVYKECDKNKIVNTNIDDVISALKDGNDDLLSSSMNNALTLASTKLLPQIDDIISQVKSEGYKMVQMTGSGSAIFVLSRNKKELYKLMEKYYDLHYTVELTKII